MLKFAKVIHRKLHSFSPDTVYKLIIDYKAPIECKPLPVLPLFHIEIHT